MKKIITFLFLMTIPALADGQFYRLYWAEYDAHISNLEEQRWRVNDSELSLHDTFGKRSEASANGLALVHIPESLFDLQKTELYLEMWGGHPHSAEKTVTINGKGTYAIPDYGTADGHCVYSYPVIGIEPSHWVRGINALQFSVDRGHSFWGHFILDEIGVKCYYRPDSLVTRYPEFANMKVKLNAPELITDECAIIKLDVDPQFSAQIDSVDFFAKYTGFDENGNLDDSDWHGYTMNRQWTHHLGTATSLYQIEWQTEIIPDQSAPVQFKAVIHFNNGLHYETEATSGTLLQRGKNSVQQFYCYDAPIPFWSRAEQIRTGKMFIPIEPEKIKRAQLEVKIWDGGEGTIKEPFTINGHAYPITSGKAVHDVVHTVIDVDPKHLVYGKNEIRLLSDTEHHGIEILRPGPCLVIWY